MSDRVHALLAAFNPDLPLEQARTIPAPWYHDCDLAALERSAIFECTWQVAGRANLIAEPSTYLTCAIAGEPVLVVRDSEGVVRAFSNVCRHRAAPLMTEPHGRASRLRCRYHGWTYDLAGRLRGTPEFDGVAGFCREDEGLPPLAAAFWGPYVWVHGGLQPTPLEEALAPMPAETAGRLEKLQFVERRVYDLACNWKVYVDNYLDGGYHVNTVHPGLAGVLDCSRYRTDTYAQTSGQRSPLRPAEPGDDVAAVRSGAEAQYWWAFPNFMLNLYDGVMDTNLVLPLAPDRCRVVFDFWFAETEGETARRFIHDSITVAEQVQREDMAICEEVQRGLGSRSFNTGRFSVRCEAAGYHFHQLLARHLHAAVESGPHGAQHSR
jgi:phenylpropionate dioxygenase-like ring-hydroxylating dioxygenase large terminal subunit